MHQHCRHHTGLLELLRGCPHRLLVLRFAAHVSHVIVAAACDHQTASRTADKRDCLLTACASRLVAARRTCNCDQLAPWIHSSRVLRVDLDCTPFVDVPSIARGATRGESAVRFGCQLVRGALHAQLHGQPPMPCRSVSLPICVPTHVPRPHFTATPVKLSCTDAHVGTNPPHHGCT